MSHPATTVEHVHTHVTDAVGYITIDRPERFNSLDVRTAQELRQASLSLARNGDVRVVVLSGVAGMFCSGADLKYIRAGGDAGDLGYLSPAARRTPAGYGERFKQILEYLHSTISEIRRAPKPFIAAVDGIAAAGGFGLAMCCDLVYASDRAWFEWAYSKTGLTGAESSTFMLPRLVGFRRALELVLLNPRLSARRAMEIGLLTDVIPAEDFDDAVRRTARALADGPTTALGVAKRLINQSAGFDRFDVHLDHELDNLARIADGPEFAEGLDSFFEKRAPQFRRSNAGHR
jgi:2-(1,2-epoxy-1,2-dihydrophenyl)acetyl-CoA isomerase